VRRERQTGLRTMNGRMQTVCHMCLRLGTVIFDRDLAVLFPTTKRSLSFWLFLVSFFFLPFTLEIRAQNVSHSLFKSSFLTLLSLPWSLLISFPVRGTFIVIPQYQGPADTCTCLGVYPESDSTYTRNYNKSHTSHPRLRET